MGPRIQDLGVNVVGRMYEDAVREVEWGMIRSREKRTKERGHGGGEVVAEHDAGFGVRELCLQTQEAEERDKPLMSS